MKHFKLWIAAVYLIILSSFLYFLFSKFSFQQLSSYHFIKSNMEYLVSFRESNLLMVSIIFITLGLTWLSILQGFGSVLVLASGFIFGAIYGTVIACITLSLGACLTYIIANYFFRDLIEAKFANKFNFIEKKIEENEFMAIFLLRVVGGIPIQIQNILPVLFNVSLKNVFFGSLGFFPQAFVVSSLGSGLENQIKKNLEPPSFFELITSFEIYGPIIAFFFLLLLAFFLRKVLYKN